MSEDERALVISGTPDNIDYPKLIDAKKMANESGCSVVVHNLCHECPSITTVPPTRRGDVSHIFIQHEDWCPVFAYHEGRELSPSQQHRHRRYMDNLK